MNKIYILCGYPYSGKTTLAKLISDKRGFKLIVFDWEWNKIFPNQNPDLEKYEELMLVYESLRKNLEEQISKGYTVVVDDISSIFWDEYIKLSKYNSVECKYIWLDVPLSEIERRRSVNLITSERHHVDDENFHKSIKLFRQPAVDRTIRFNFGDDLDKFIEGL